MTEKTGASWPNWVMAGSTVIAVIAAILSWFEAHRTANAAATQTEITAIQTKIAEEQAQKLDDRQLKLEKQQEAFERDRREEKQAKERSDFLELLQDISLTQASVLEAMALYDESDLGPSISISLSNSHAMLIRRAEQLLPLLEARNEVTPEEYLVLCQAAFSQGRYVEAVEWADKSKGSDNQKLVASALRILGDIAYAQGHSVDGYRLYEDSEKAIEKAVNLQPEEQNQLRVQYRIFWYNSECNNGNADQAKNILNMAKEALDKLKSGPFKTSAANAIETLEKEHWKKHGTADHDTTKDESTKSN